MAKERSTIEVYYTDLNPAQRAEDDFFNSDKSMCSMSAFYKQLFWKARSIWLLEEIISRYQLEFRGKVLELAGGYGAQAAYLKAKYRDAIELYYSDVSKTAVVASERFEDFFYISIDHKWVIEAETISARDEFFDVVFFFASFHHLQDQSRAVQECHRVLKPGGKLYLLLEPACPRLLSWLYHKKTGQRAIFEQSYTRRDYRQMLARFSSLQQHNFVGYFNRETKRSLLYYLLLSLLPSWVGSMLPCSQVLIAQK